MSAQATEMTGVIERAEGMTPELVEADGEISIKAFCEAGYRATYIDVPSLIAWLRANRPDLLT